ncbi:unnamed protein product [Calicophoron daubneyi]|uniref:Uncharacterized protein n=1 Tax=Calicophoron daubneyi TaxID=300641 RepID=A0AAV2TI78_CALDB
MRCFWMSLFAINPRLGRCRGSKVTGYVCPHQLYLCRLVLCEELALIQRYFRLKEEILCPYHYWSVVSLVLSPNERFLAYSILTERVQLVRLGDGVTESKLAVLQASDNGSNVSKTFSVCFDGTGDRLIAGHNSGVIRVYDIHGPQCEQVQTVSDCGSSDLNAVTTVDITGHTILAGGDDTNIRLFDLRALNKGALAVFTGHFDGITYLDPKQPDWTSQDPTGWGLVSFKTAGGSRSMESNNPSYSAKLLALVPCALLIGAGCGRDNQANHFASHAEIIKARRTVGSIRIRKAYLSNLRSLYTKAS